MSSDRQMPILTVDTIQGYEGVVIPFPETIGYFGRGGDTDEALQSANEELRERAEKLGANAVLSVRYSRPNKYGSGQWWIYATGTPVILDPLPMDPHEYAKYMNNQDDDLREV